jgi:oligopeptide/dipeptide ABC transporter ATP-binding protein
VIIITQVLGVVAGMADQVAVMYAGYFVEISSVQEIFDRPRHPYTRALMGSIPRMRIQSERLTTIEGAPPNLIENITGCPFLPRCVYHVEQCEQENPLLIELTPGHSCACWVARSIDR